MATLSIPCHWLKFNVRNTVARAAPCYHPVDSMAQPKSEAGNARSVLLLAFYFPPENAAGAARPYRLYKYLPRFGYCPYVITSSEQDPARPAAGVTCVSSVRHPSKRSVEGILEGLLWRTLVTADEGTTWAPLAFRAAGRVVPVSEMAAVISTSPPLNTHLAALLLKRRYGVKWIADFRDPLYLNPFRHQTGRKARVDAALERWIFRWADAVVANTDAAAERLVRRYPQYAHKVHLIWNGFDPDDEASPVPIPAARPRTLVHAGMIYRNRHPGALLASLERLIGRGLLEPSTVRIRLLGGMDSAGLDRGPFARLEQIGCLACPGTVPRAAAMAECQGADYQLLLDVQGETAGVQVPSKVFDLLRIGRPILACTTRNSPLERILAQGGVPYRCLYKDDGEEQTDRQVLEFLSLPSTPVNASPWFWNTFDGMAQAGTVAGLIDGLTGKAARAHA
jgi:glycosyltransferase involved in cell wall biosynthesis